MKKRNQCIDTLRGLACLVLVSYHIVGVSQQGLQIESGIYRELNDLLSYIRMPLFTFLSGVVYAFRPYSGDALGFVKGKSRRLILPMLMVGTVFAIMQAVVPGANGAVQSWWLLHVLPVGHFWFVESLFLIFLVLIPLESLKLLHSPLGMFVVLLATCGLYTSDIFIPYFSITGALYLFPFFLMGVSLQRFDLGRFLVGNVKLWLGGGLIALMALMGFDAFDRPAFREPLALALGAAGCFFLVSLRMQWKPLIYIGSYSYAIYLYHVFYTAGTRVVLSAAGVSDLGLIYSVSLVAGIAGPMMLERIFDRHWFGRVALLGKAAPANAPAYGREFWLRGMSYLLPRWQRARS